MLYLLGLEISKVVEVVLIVNKCICKAMNVFQLGKIKMNVFINRYIVFY